MGSRYQELLEGLVFLLGIILGKLRRGGGWKTVPLRIILAQRKEDGFVSGLNRNDGCMFWVMRWEVEPSEDCHL